MDSANPSHTGGKTSDAPASRDSGTAPHPATGRYFRSGLGLRQSVRPAVASDYHSSVVQSFKDSAGTLTIGDITFRLAKEFGFCYGVERAVDYAYETVHRFPDKRIVLTGEIIHNPEVNSRLRSLGILFLGDPEVPGVADLLSTDVVILPAFGVRKELFEELRDSGAIVVDTTCGSVLNVWKNVERYAQEGRTSIVHGKAGHEETLATVSRACSDGRAQYLIVLDKAEAELVAGYIRGASQGGDSNRSAFMRRFAGKVSPGFDPDESLSRIGMANQTTMLSGETLEIAAILRESIEERYGREEAPDRFRVFDTICSATQDRQDALHELVAEPFDLVLVIGGFNSSNTAHLLEIACKSTAAFHITGPECLISESIIRHKPVQSTEAREEHLTRPWIPPGQVRVGLTAGASTPDLVIGNVVERVVSLHRGGA